LNNGIAYLIFDKAEAGCPNIWCYTALVTIFLQNFYIVEPALPVPVTKYFLCRWKKRDTL